MPRDDGRRLAFGGVAELYDEARPSYPSALVDDVIAFGVVEPPERLLEVGAGTGKATVLFAAQGFDVLGIEPSPEMAALARRNCARYAGVRIEETDFERWAGEPAGFRLLFSAQAWHWIAPDAGYAKARAALVEGGAFAAFWNYPSWAQCEVRDELAGAYARAGYEPAPGDPINPATEPDGALHHRYDEVASADGFSQAECRTYRWSLNYSTSAYLRLMQTHSTHILLTEESRRRLLAEVGAVIDRHGGSLTLPLVTQLHLARAGS
jgi:SAM-dependent methyltransferase